MKRLASTILLGLMAFTLSACAAEADTSIQNIVLATETSLPPTATIVWFPPSATPSAVALPSKQPTPERKPGVGNLLLSDSFSSASFWNPAISDEASIDVSRNRLTIAVQPGVNAFRVRQGPVFTDFYAEITARPSLCRGADQYGLLFRARNNVAYYGFVLSCNGTAGVERFRLNNRPTVLQSGLPSADVPPGAPGEVRLGVWVSGKDMRFFLNGRYQFTVSDGTYGAGGVGAFARSAGDTPVTVTFSDLAVFDVTYIEATSTPMP
jgi:hypothetical protein